MFCCRRCQVDYIYITEEKEAKNRGFYKNEPIAKKCLIYKHGLKCSICGGDNWYGKPMPIILDHINGQSGDNSINNLRLVCPNCDTFTDTYKGRNIGKGGIKRRHPRNSR